MDPALKGMVEELPDVGGKTGRRIGPCPVLKAVEAVNRATAKTGMRFREVRQCLAFIKGP